jgi:hypothetical protein
MKRRIHGLITRYRRIGSGGMTFCLMLTALVGIETRLVPAQWSADPQFGVPVCVKDSTQANPRMAFDGNNGAIIVWEDYRSSSTSTDIYAQSVSEHGYVRWSPTDGIPVCCAPGVQRRPEIVSDDAGGVIIVWEDSRNGSFDIYAQRIDNSGAPRWQPNGVPICTAAWAQQYPAIIPDGLGGAIMCWQDSRVAGYAVYAQRISATGNAHWASNGIVVCDFGSSQLFPRLATDGRNGAIFVWEDGRVPTSGRDIYAQWIRADGVPQWTPNGVVVCIASSNQQTPQIISDGQRGAIVAWQDFRASATSSADIFAQRLNPAGTALWQTNGVPICIASNNQGGLKIVPDHAGGAILAWIDTRSGYTSRVYSQRISAAGALLWNKTDVDICPHGSNMDRVSLVADDVGGALYVWQDGRSGANNINIYAQRLDSMGIRDPRWPERGVVVCSATGNKSDPQILAPANRKAIVAWCDQRRDRTGADIYASALYPDSASLVPVTFLSVTATTLSHGVRLAWETTGESNLSSYLVQRAVSTEPWEDIGALPAEGRAGGEGRYSFVDASPVARTSPMLSYRIVAQDFDGSRQHSPVMTVFRSDPAAAALSLSLAPNPVVDHGTLSLVLNQPDRITLRILDINGRTVLSLREQEPVSAGLTAIPVSFSAIPRGIYFAELRTSSARKICGLTLY